MRRALCYIRRQMVAFTVAVIFSIAALPVHAALPTEATAAFTSMGTDATALIAAGWPVLVIVVGGLLIMKLFRKVLGKST